MKGFIMYETRFGNGKKLAESLKTEFPEDFEISTADVKDISPEVVANENPDFLILGGAIRMFRGAPKSKRWVKNLNKLLEKNNHKIKYATGFLTHAMPTDKIQGWVKRYLKKFLKANMIEKTYSELLTARVKGQEGPIFEEEMDKSKEYAKNFLNWINN
jgi:menaquinone-dependent protoporphyrinogen IX oxidase